MFSHFGKTLAVGHWHNDMPGLTPEAKIIALARAVHGESLPIQTRVFGFQYPHGAHIGRCRTADRSFYEKT